MKTTQPNQVLHLALSKGVIRAKDLDPLGIPRTVLQRLVDSGALIQVGRGLYMSPETDITPQHTLVEVASRVPNAVVNLLSALAFHELTDELPHAVWIAIPRGSQAPKLNGPKLEFTWTARRFLEIGVTKHQLEGIEVPVTDPARTVADCFKFRSRIGLDLAITALRDYLRLHPKGHAMLWEAAGACRVQTVIRPYLESLS
jgi:predicted transcriptional regulator of viral defense system